MTRTVLIAVHDSAASFAAAEAAMRLAARLGDAVHAVMVHVPEATSGARAGDEARPARAAPVFAHLAALADREAVPLTTQEATGQVARVVLDLVDRLDAEFVVVATADRPGSAIPHLGSHSLRILEFSPVPVLVVPAPSSIARPSERKLAPP